MDANSLLTRNKIYKDKDSTGTSQMNTKAKYHLAFKSMEPDENTRHGSQTGRLRRVWMLERNSDSRLIG